jgi:hypothetical protein
MPATGSRARGNPLSRTIPSKNFLTTDEHRWTQMQTDFLARKDLHQSVTIQAMLKSPMPVFICVNLCPSVVDLNFFGLVA